MKKFLKSDSKRYVGIRLLCIVFGLLCMGHTVHAADTLILKAGISDDQSVLLTWEAKSTDLVYEIARADRPDGRYSVVARVSKQTGTVSCYDYGVKLGNTYYYRVSGLEDTKVAEVSNVVSVVVTLPAPADVKAKKWKEKKVKLSWSKVKGASGYRVYRSSKKSGGYKKIATTKNNTFVDEDVKSGKIYYYKVQSYKKKNSRLTSSTKKYTGVYMKPDVPELSGRYTKKKIKLSWEKVRGASTYYLYKKNKKGKYSLLGKTKMLCYTDRNVKEGKSYEYKIAAAYKKDGKEIKSKMSKVFHLSALALDPNKKMVALTFDDGPGKYTNEIVKCLKKNNAKATFFVLGCNVDSYKGALKAADKIGCEIGNHSYNHKDFTRLSKKEIQAEIDRTDKKVKNVIGKNTSLVRTPGGSVNSTVKETVGKPIVLWSIDTLDWKTRSREKTIKAVVENVKDGDIILMHDIYEPSKEAALVLIKELNRKGYQLVTVSELAKYRGYQLQKGTVYRNLRKK